MSGAPRIPVSCPCGRRLTVRADLAGSRGRCPSCGRLLEIPAAAAPQADLGAGRAKLEHTHGATCAVCQTLIEEGDQPVGCQACDSPYHRECWNEYGGCAAYGCANAPKQEPKRDVEKQCPFCAELIPAKVTRCPSCRERFEDARPLDEGYVDGLLAEPQLKATRQKAFWFLAASILPCVGPVTAVVGWTWLQSGSSQLEEAGGVYATMVKAGAMLGVTYTGLHVLLLVGAFLS